MLIVPHLLDHFLVNVYGHFVHVPMSRFELAENRCTKDPPSDVR